MSPQSDSTAMVADRLLDREEAADMLGLSPATLAAWAMDGRHLPVVRLGRRVKYRLRDIEAYVEASTSPAGERRKGA